MLTTNPQSTIATSYNPILITPETSRSFQMYHLQLLTLTVSSVMLKNKPTLFILCPGSTKAMNDFSTTTLPYTIVFRQNVSLSHICSSVAFGNFYPD